MVPILETHFIGKSCIRKSCMTLLDTQMYVQVTNKPESHVILLFHCPHFHRLLVRPLNQIPYLFLHTCLDVIRFAHQILRVTHKEFQNSMPNLSYSYLPEPWKAIFVLNNGCLSFVSVSYLRRDTRTKLSYKRSTWYLPHSASPLVLPLSSLWRADTIILNNCWELLLKNFNSVPSQLYMVDEAILDLSGESTPCSNMDLVWSLLYLNREKHHPKLL